MATEQIQLSFFYAGLSDTLRMGLLTLVVLAQLQPAYNVGLLLLLVLLLTSVVTTGSAWFTLRTETRLAQQQRAKVEQRIYTHIGLGHLTVEPLQSRATPEQLPPLKPLATAGWHLVGALAGAGMSMAVALLFPATTLTAQLPGALLLLAAIAATAWLQAPLMGRKRTEALLRITGTTLAAAVLLIAVAGLLGN